MLRVFRPRPYLYPGCKESDFIMPRNFSINAHFRKLGEQHRPTYRFAGQTQDDWRAWRNALLPALRATLGRMPTRVPLNPEIVSETREDGLVKQRVVFDVEEGLSAAAWVFRPADRPGRLPGILACHGHGPFGKDAVMGQGTAPELLANIKVHNYSYGLALAKAGYAVIAIDWRGFGERNEPEGLWGRDICNVHYIKATILGMTVLGMDVNDGTCTIDYLCGQEYVDPGRIGVLGLSFGGTMTTWISICDERIRAADNICYSDRFADFALGRANFCGSQITPGLFELCDMPDLQGLFAPKPLLVEIGRNDDCFHLDSAMSCFREVEKIYSAAGARRMLELDLFDGGHQWGGNKTLEFFAKHLNGQR